MTKSIPKETASAQATKKEGEPPVQKKDGLKIPVAAVPARGASSSACRIGGNQTITLTFGDCAENHVGMQ